MAGELDSKDGFRKTMDIVARMHCITEFVRLKKKGGLEAMLAYLEENDFREISRRTLQRDLTNLREQFGYNIQYNYSFGYYELKQDEVYDDHDGFLKLVEMATRMEDLSRSIRGLMTGSPYLLLEHRHSTQRFSDLIGKLIAACHNKKIVRFMYNSYSEHSKTDWRSVEPYAVVEMNNMWYLYCYSLSSKGLRTYALDRMDRLEDTGKVFATPKKKVKAEDHLKNVVGISAVAGEAEKIRLKFSALMAKYERSFPIHNSQKVVEISAEGEMIVEYELIINFELKHKIRALGAHVQVLEPRHLAEEIHNELKSLLQTYERQLKA